MELLRIAAHSFVKISLHLRTSIGQLPARFRTASLAHPTCTFGGFCTRTRAPAPPAIRPGVAFSPLCVLSRQPGQGIVSTAARIRKGAFAAVCNNPIIGPQFLTTGEAYFRTYASPLSHHEALQRGKSLFSRSTRMRVALFNAARPGVSKSTSKLSRSRVTSVISCVAISTRWPMT